MIVAGDFNATADHGPMGRLLASGLRDAFDEAGRGVGATWPSWRGPMIPVMRLDHVLVRGPITVLSAEVQDNRGSDHRLGQCRGRGGLIGCGPCYLGRAYRPTADDRVDICVRMFRSSVDAIRGGHLPVMLTARAEVLQ